MFYTITFFSQPPPPQKKKNKTGWDSPLTIYKYAAHLYLTCNL